nr:MAG TPA: hypothetical protein [Caudoviricetes sp.]
METKNRQPVREQKCRQVGKTRNSARKLMALIPLEFPTVGLLWAKNQVKCLQPTRLPQPPKGSSRNPRKKLLQKRKKIPKLQKKRREDPPQRRRVPQNRLGKP